jgi:hypothetical protein
MSQCNPFQPNFQALAFGANVDRLKQIKNAYDPKNTFWVFSGIGKEVFELDDEGFLHLPQ